MERAQVRKVAKRAGVAALVALALLVATMTTFYAAAALRQTQDFRAAAPASGRFVQGADVAIFVQEKGPIDGPPVVLIHGTGAWSGLWAETMDALSAEGYRAIALDVPPFGFSEKPADGSYSTADQARRISGALGSLGVENATIVAHSFGSRAAMEAVLAQPDRVGRVVLVDAALDLRHEDAGAGPLARGALAVPPLRGLLVASTLENPLLTRAFLKSLVYNDSAATDERVAVLQQPLVVKGTTKAGGEWLRAFTAAEPPGLANDASAYRALTMPVLLLWGEEDDITPPERAGELHDAIPGAQLVLLPGAGHIPQIEDPTAFQRALLTFLARTSGPSPS